MAQLTHEQYDALERAVVMGTRVAIFRSGRRENVVVPLALRVQDGREVIATRHPTTGQDLMIYVDEIDALEAVG
jgi:hypothetical protein